MIKFQGIRTIAFLSICLFSVASRAASDWETDFEAAKRKAVAEKKDILIDFTGSDWCGWCIKLKEEVFNKDEFKTAATGKFVLLELDFPRGTPQDEKLKKQNKALSEKYKVQGFPSIYLIDAQGRAYGKTGYQPGGPEAYLKHLAGFQDAKAKRDELLGKGGAAQGAEKAKLLDEALALLEENEMLIGYDAEIEQIIAADAENKAGLKGKYLARAQMQEIEAAFNEQDWKKGLATIERLLKEFSPNDAQKQQALAMKSTALTQSGDEIGGAAALKEAIAIAPNSKAGKQLRLGELQMKLKADMSANEPDKALAKVESFMAAVDEDAEMLNIGYRIKVAILNSKKDDAAKDAVFPEAIKRFGPDTSMGKRWRMEWVGTQVEKDLKADQNDAAAAKIAAFRKEAGEDKELLQSTYMIEALYLHHRNDFKGLYKSLTDGQAINPTTEMGQRLGQMLESIKNDPRVKAAAAEKPGAEKKE